MRSACITMLAYMSGFMLQPTTLRLNRSITATKYNQPSSVGMYVTGKRITQPFGKPT